MSEPTVVKYICSRPNCMMFYQKSYKVFDPQRGETKVPSKILKFTQFSRLKTHSYLVVDLNTEDGKKMADCIEKSVDFRTKAVQKFAADFYPAGERASVVATPEFTNRPKDRFLRMFKSGSTWSCAFCGYQTVKESIQPFVDHLRIQHGIDIENLPLDGGEVEATIGQYKGKKVLVYRDKQNLDTAIAQSVGYGNMKQEAKIGNDVEITQATRQGTKKLSGKVMRINKHSVTIQTPDGRIDDIRKSNIENVKIGTTANVEKPAEEEF